MNKGGAVNIPGGVATQPGSAAAALGVPTSNPAAQPNPASISSLHRWGIVILLVLIAIIDFFFSSDVTWLLGVNVILGLFGIIHLFAKGLFHKIVLGIVPLVLAVMALPSVVGGVSFTASLPFLSAIAPGYWFRYVLLLGVILYYYFSKNLPSVDDYKGMTGAAVNTKWKFSIGRWIIVFLLIALIYGFENGGGLSTLLGLGDVGLYLVPTILLIVGFMLLFRPGLDRLIGFVSLLMGVIGILDFTGYGYLVDWIFWPLMPGAIVRYIAIAIIISFVLRGRAQSSQ